MIHELKCWPEQFELIRLGVKLSEVRYDDRGYQGGDVLKLQEWSVNGQSYTGRTLFAHVRHIFRLDSAPGLFNLPQHTGTVVMSIRVLR